MKMKLTRSQLAETIADTLKELCQTEIQIKNNKIHVCLSQGKMQYGFISINPGGIGWHLTTYGKKAFGSTIQAIIDTVEIIEPKQVAV